MRFFRKFAALWRRDRLDAEMAEEMRAHLEFQAEENERRGLPPAEARDAAQREFGNLMSLQARTREQRDPFLVRQWSQLALDLRFSVRQLVKHRWFSAAIIATIALGIGSNTAVFTLVNAALFKPVPLPRGDRLVGVLQEKSHPSIDYFLFSLPEFREYRSANHTFEALEAVALSDVVISEKSDPPGRYLVGTVTPGLFEMLRVAPILGRGFLPSDARPGAVPVALLSFDVWQGRYGGAPDVIGRVVQIDGQATEIVGVMPSGFKFPTTQDLWRPLVPTKLDEEWGHRDLTAFGLLKSGVSLTQAQADLSTISARLARSHPDTNKELGVSVQTFQQMYNGGQVRLVFLLALGAVVCVLLIACANVANMLLSRGLARHREIAVRSAMGASRWQIVRQLLIESVMLSVTGGVIGLGLSTYGVAAFDRATQDVGKPFWVQFTMDWRAFAYFGVISVFSGIAFGLVPALRASRIDLNTALKDGAGGATPKRVRLAGALVVLQFALTVVLLSGAGLLIRSLLVAEHINPFIPAEHLLTARLNLPDGKGERYETPDARRRMHEKLQSRLAALPGVTSAVLTSDFPGVGSQTRDIEVEGHPASDTRQPARVGPIFASPNFLTTIGLPLLQGRALAATDGDSGRESAVVTRTAAARFWPGESPLGHRFRFVSDGKPGAWITVVGVCGDLVQETQVRDAPPVVLLSDRQEPWAWLGLMLRTHEDPTALANSVRRAVQDIDPNLPLFDVRTLPAAIEHKSWFLKVFGSLFLVFALFALLLASVGIYAVVAHATARRAREVGIRMALGATGSGVVRLLVSGGLVQLGTGLGLGLAGALAATRLMDHMIGMVSPQDPVVFGGVTLLLVGIGLFACWLPARRAAKVDPVVALRCE